jgi:hypothetical protein
MRNAVRAQLACLGLLTVPAFSGCQQPQPQLVCSAPATTKEITSILFGRAKEAAGPFFGPHTGEIIDKLFGPNAAKYDLVVFDGEDPQTHKITCSARLTLTATVPGNADRKPATASLDPIHIVFSRQPTADGGGQYVYTVNQADDVAKAIFDGLSSISLSLSLAPTQGAAPSGLEIVKDPALLQAAFSAVFPSRESAGYSGQGCTVKLVYKPNQLIRTGATYVLVSTSTTPTGSDNPEVCFGSANVAYLSRANGDGFTVSSQHTYDDGHAGGFPPDVAINSSIAAWPVLAFSYGPASEQGCTTASTELVGLTPGGQKSLATFVSSYSPDATDDGQASGFDTAIEPGADRNAFKVTYTGAIKRTITYRVDAQGQYQPDQSAPTQSC